jgi:lipopolysaccharide transport system ATP-binding protein
VERIPENHLAVPAIHASGLSKCYHLYDRPALRLLQLFGGERRRYYREFWALRDATFEVARGEVVGIIGRNGAGKSTLLQLVCGTLTPTGGAIAVNGRVAALLELGAGFNPEFSGRENVVLAASILGLTKAEIDARLEDIIDFSGIREFIDQPVKFYSSGMYVRISFAVATSVDPDVLVIDEALSVGDGEFARKSFDRIVALKKAGVTILFCSHALYQVEAFCDRVLWLEHGRVMMLGKPQEVIQKYTEFLGVGNAPASDQANGANEHSVARASAAAPGYARITHVEVAVDGQVGRELNARPRQSTLEVSVQFDSDPDLPPPVLGVTLDYGTLLAVTCAVSRSDGVVVERDAAGRGEAKVVFPELALRKGRYRVGLYLGCENALHVYDSVAECATVLVEDMLPEPGLVTLPHEWHSQPGHSGTLAATAPLAEHSASPSPSLPEPRWRKAKLCDGRVLWVDQADSLGLAANGTFEPDEAALCVALLRPGDRVLDIGANVGYYTTLFATCVGNTGRIDADEPDPENFALLDANTRELQANGRVRLHSLALTEKSGSIRLFRSKDNAGMHRVYDSVCCDGTAIYVMAKRGDELSLDPLDFIKIDVEGFEPAVLNGLSATLDASPNVRILCEYSPMAMIEAGLDPRRWLEWMDARGFRALAFDGRQWTNVACDDLRTQTARLNAVDIAKLTHPLKGSDNAAITAAAAAAARACGYTRPIVENLLFVRDADTHVIRVPAFDTQEKSGETERYTVDLASTADEEVLLDLFARAFGHAMPAAQWRWKYAGIDPVGTLVHRGKRVIAFYGGMPRSVRCHGEPMTAVQIGDVMVDPVERAVLMRKGPFFLAASAFAERFMGSGSDYAFAFGFPSERHARLGERLALYERVDDVLEATWPPLPPRAGLLHRTRELREQELGIVDGLWQRMADELRHVVLGVRDSAYIRRRFLEHPAAKYLVLLVRRRLGGQPRGVLVLRDHGQSGIELIDVVAPPDALMALVAVARRVAGRLGRPKVFAWMTPRAADSFKASGPTLQRAGIPVPTIVWKTAPDLEKLRGHWWLLGGDADSR